MQKRQKHRKQEQREYGEEPLLLFSFLVILPRTILLLFAMYCVVLSVQLCFVLCVVVEENPTSELQTANVTFGKRERKGKGKGRRRKRKNVGEMETGKQEEERGEEGE